MRLFTFFCFILFAVLPIAKGFGTVVASDTLRILLMSETKDPLHGGYVVNKSKHFLITTSEKQGACLIPHIKEWEKDTIEFSFLGYLSQQIAYKDIENSNHVILQPDIKQLEEVVVKGIHPDKLLEKVVKQLQAKRQKYDINFYGKAQYEKITECNHLEVGFLQEYGYYFTSGNVPQKEKWDLKFYQTLIPIHVARSYNLLPNGQDTLKNATQRTGKLRYDAYAKKIYHAIRAVQLWGPLFSGLKHYDILPIESNSEHYLFSFTTKKQSFPDKISLFSRGTLEINKETHQLERICFDYIDYHFLQLTRKIIPQPPFASKLELTFAYHTNYPYVQSAKLLTIWKHNGNKEYNAVELPSRRNPATNHLIEKEAFYCEAFFPIPPEKQHKYLLKMINLASQNPQIAYSEELFQTLPSLLDRTSAWEQLNQYQDLLQQFIHNSNKAYYGNDFGDYLMTHFKNPRLEIQKTKNHVLQIFTY